jgi:dipeptidyl aminopeptidase/acylaminoacyl peptidase
MLCRVPMLAVAAVALLAGPVRAEAPKRTHDITIDDYFTLATLFDCVLSPDGKHVAYTEGRWQESTDDRKADLWVVPVTGGPARRLTADRAGDRAVKWSPDGRTIYFLGNRKREGEKRPPNDGKTQVWRIGLDGGEPFAVTRVESGVTLFGLAGDGRSLYYTTEGEHVSDEWKDLRQQFRQIEYGHGIDKVSPLWRLDLQNWRTDKVFDDNRYIRDMAVSPDGQRIALITTPDDKVVSFEGLSRVDILDTQSRKIETVPDEVFRAKAPSPYGWLEHLAWSADSKRLAFNVIFDAYPAEIIVAEWGADGIKTRKVERPAGLSVKGYGSPLGWRGTSQLCFLGEEKARVRVCAVSMAGDRLGEVRRLTPGDVVVGAFSLDRSGQSIALVMNGPGRFEDIHFLSAGSQPRRLTDVNPQTAMWKIPKLSIVSWKGPGGAPVEGILELPPDAKEGQKLPLVVAIHGGPTTADSYQLQYWIYGRTLLPAKGYAVLCPNYRGSTGYGDRFLTDLVGRENELDVGDILAGVDALVARGVADPDRLGVMGWSNGGYLTNCIISRTTRFKAASSGAGIVDTVMQWGSNDEPAYMIVFKKGFPWNAADNYHKASSTYQLEKIRTPTLIHVGGNDERCPPAHSRMLHRALKEYVQVPTELLVYPGEPHGLMKYKNRKAKMAWDLAWFDRYILGKHGKAPMPMPMPTRP